MRSAPTLLTQTRKGTSGASTEFLTIMSKIMKNWELPQAVLRKYVLPTFKRIFLVSLGSIVLTLALTVAAFATSYSQGEKIDLEVHNARLSTVLPLLEQKGKIRLMYGEEVDQLDKAVTLAVNDTPVLDVLEHVLRNTDLEFVALDGDLVVIKKWSIGKQAPVRGMVRNAAGDPLSGVSVVLKGTSVGGSTDDRGQFTIEAPADGTLVFTYIGYLALEVSVNGQSTLDITLQADEQELGEVV